MNRDKNSYTIIYAIVMVVIVAVALAFTAQTLREPQEKNEQKDKIQQILRSAGQDASDKSTVIDQYNTLIKQVLLVKKDGSIAESYTGDELIDNEAFRMNTANAMREAASGKDVSLPVYVAELDGEPLYIFPINGAGLWGALWGYISVEADGNTIHGADFSHASETPGLGAEVSTHQFSDEFKGKHLFVGEELVSVAVIKPGRKPEVPGQDYVDGISGGTLTSDGVHDMLRKSFEFYTKYLESIRSGAAIPTESSEQLGDVVTDAHSIDH